MEEIGKLSVLRTVGGGVLYAENPDRKLASFTNLFMGQMMQLTKLFQTLKEKGELAE